MKKIVFLSASATDIADQLDKIQEYERERDWQVVAVATRYGAQRACEHHGIPFKTTMDYLTPERHRRAYTDSIKLAGDWYQHPLLEETLGHDGVSLGEMMEYDSYLLFAGFFLDVELYRGIIETEKPDRIALMKRAAPLSVPPDTTDMGVKEDFIIGALADEQGVALEWLTATQVNEVDAPKTTKKPFLRRALSYLRARAIDYVGMILFLNWRRELRRDFRRWWNYCFAPWTARRPVRTFSRKKRKIAFYGMRCAENIADYLRRDSGNGVICLLGPGHRWRARNSVPQIYLESFSTPEIDAVVAEKRNIFKSILERDEIKDHLQKIFAYHGLNFREIALKKLEYLLDVQYPLMVRGMELMKEMIDRAGLDIFIATSDLNPVSRATTRALQSKGKKALVLPHGIDYFSPEASESFGKFLVPPVADKVAAWGQASQEWFISRGAPPEKVEAASCGDFDDYIKIFKHSKDSIRRYLGIPPDKKVILYVLDHGNRNSRYPYIAGTRDEIIHNLKDVIKEVAGVPELYLIVRTHPGDKHPEEIRQIIRNGGQTNVICSNSPLIYQLQAMDALLTYTSSAAVEAMIFGKNVIIYNPTGRPEVMSYAQDGAALKITKKEELVPGMLGILGDGSLTAELAEGRERFVRRGAGSLNGRATQNISNLILEMIGGGKEE